MINKEELIRVITNGKLKSYGISAGFISVYWQLEELPEGTYYLLMFTQTDNILTEFKRVTPYSLPIKYKARKYQSMIITLVTSLIK